MKNNENMMYISSMLYAIMMWVFLGFGYVKMDSVYIFISILFFVFMFVSSILYRHPDDWNSPITVIAFILSLPTFIIITITYKIYYLFKGGD